MANENLEWQSRSAFFEAPFLSDEEDSFSFRSRRTSTATEASFANEEVSSEDDALFNSLPGDELSEWIDYRFLDFKTRRSRCQKKNKGKDSYFSHRASRDRGHKSVTVEKEEDDGLLLTYDEDSGNDGQKRMDVSKRKRSFNHLRMLERDAKFDINSTSPSDIASSLPAISSQSSMKIGTTNHFRSLNSKPVAPKEVEESNASNVNSSHTPSRNTVSDNIRRIEFYTTFSMLIRMGNAEPKLKDEHNFTRQRSHEEQLWQNKLNDLLWLELRAWHNGRSLQLEDQVLCTERERIGIVLNEIMNFKFVSTAGVSTCRCGSASSFSSQSNMREEAVDDVSSSEVICEYPGSPLLNKQTSRLHSVSKRKLGISIPSPCNEISNQDDHMVNDNGDLTFGFNPAVECCGLCSIYCQYCINNQNEALRQVKHLLDQLDTVESLYPSSRAMKKAWEFYTTSELESRVRTLCLYYNLVTDLRQKISTLGKMLSSLGGKNLKWPYFHSSFETDNDLKNDKQANEPASDVSMMIQTDSEISFNIEDDFGDVETPSISYFGRERKFSKSVRFENTEDTLVRPSLESPVECSSTNDIPLITKLSSSTPNDSPDLTPTPTKEFNFSTSLYMYSVKEADEHSVVSPYRSFVDKFLKQKGLRKLLQRLMELVQNTLCRAKFALEKKSDIASTKSPDLQYLIEEPLRLKPSCTLSSRHCCKKADEWAGELACYGACSEHYKKMALPSFRALYLFLLTIPLEIMHECLKLRLEKQPEVPSNLSIRQLMRECKEAIKAAIIIRQKYVHMNRAVLAKSEFEKVEQGLTEYDTSVKKMLQSYLRYLHSWVQMMLKSVQQNQKNVLEEEWTFVKVFSCYVQRGEALASEMFCSMASNILDSTGHFLETNLDNCTSVHDRMLLESDISSSTRHNILQSCRDFKEVFQETRKRALKAVAFAKMLRKDLEIAAEFEIMTSVDDVLQNLKNSDHIRLIAPHSSSFVVFIPGHIQNNRPYLWQLLNMTYGHEHSAAPDNVESEGYLVILCCDGCSNLPEFWNGPSLVIEPTAEITINLSHLKVEGLLLVVNHSSQLGLQRKAFQTALGDAVRVTKEFTSCNQSIADSLMDLKKEVFCLRDKIKDAISLVEERLDMDSISDLEEFEKLNLQARCREILHQCYNFGFEYHKEMTRLVTGEARTKLGQGLIDFAKQWMTFVSKKCERGRGVRPRWANKGLEFLMTACEPLYLTQLTDDEYLTLKQAINDCISHLIGSINSRPNNNLISVSRSQSPTPRSRPGNIRHSSSYSGESFNSYPRSVSVISSKSEPVSSTNFLLPVSSEPVLLPEDQNFKERRKSLDSLDVQDDIMALTIQNELPIDRIQNAVKQLEDERERILRQNSVIGRVIGKSTNTSFVQISARRVTFHWQKGIKIGQGRFGKVYTAVNNDTGDLMALKEMHLQPNDHKTIKEIADELKIFEGIRHKYLVRYYGVEIHREEMFVFMEYCDCGTLESAAQHGLPEPLIRKYTRQLLEATSVLHEHGIVHRDIKGANIFLTSDGNLKLGDFGCCIKLKNHSTMPGELNAFVGTQAFMAPEVFTKPGNEGHGRAADIWSIACVVVEMATGSRPWPELESNYQIMFKVGTGETPEIPENLSAEGIDFLSHCFKFEPRERWTAIMLLDHPFTKVDSEEEFQSITFFPDIHQY